MKRFYAFIMLLSLGSVSFVGCSKNTSKGILGGSAVGGTVVKTVATVVGLILLSKLLKSVLKTIGTSTTFAGLSQNSNSMSTFNEDTKLNSFVQNDVMKTALQVLVAEHYQIPFTKVANSYSSLNTLGDLATFIGENASAKSLADVK